jgi:signal transduction histidine kinase
LLSATVVVGFLNSLGWRWQTLREVGPEMLVSMSFSILLGWWIYRVIDQSLERAGLIAQLEETRAELITAHHAQGVMAERERMAREIHDTLAQGFASVVMLAQAAGAALDRRPGQVAADLATIETVARENLAEARALVAAFSPVDLDGTTLTQAVRRLAERFGRQTGVEVDLEVRDGVAGLSREQEVVLLRTVQEALTNVRRHAAARHVAVLLLADDEGARVEVRDDGTGFSQPAEDGFGLSGMRRRVSEIGGVLDVASAPGAGTRVVVRLPGTGVGP